MMFFPLDGYYCLLISKEKSSPEYESKIGLVGGFRKEGKK
jgi:hypothetical protein